MIRQQLLISALALSAACQATTQLEVSPLSQLGDTDRTWIGEDFFANRLQDWRIRGGRLECTLGAKKSPLRTAQLLTTALSSSEGSFSASVSTGAVKEGALEAGAFHGFLLGGGGEHVDYRLSAMIHSKPGEDGGLLAVLGADGHVRVHDNSGAYSGGSWSVSGPLKAGAIPVLDESDREGEGYGEAGPVPTQLSLFVRPDGDTYTLQLSARSMSDGALLSEALYEDLPPHQLDGCLGLVSHLGTTKSRSGFWFQDWALEGSKLDRHPERAWGPLLSCQHTLSEGTLKLTAQTVPLGVDEGSLASLEIKRGGQWREVARTELTPLSYTYPFRVDDWDGSRDTPYRVTSEVRAPTVSSKSAPMKESSVRSRKTSSSQPSPGTNASPAERSAGTQTGSGSPTQSSSRPSNTTSLTSSSSPGIRSTRATSSAPTCLTTETRSRTTSTSGIDGVGSSETSRETSPLSRSLMTTTSITETSGELVGARPSRETA